MKKIFSYVLFMLKNILSTNFNTTDLIIFIEKNQNKMNMPKLLSISIDGIKLAISEKNDFAQMLFSYYSLAALYKIELEKDDLHIHGELIESIFALSHKTVSSNVQTNPMKESAKIILKLYAYSEDEKREGFKNSMIKVMEVYKNFDKNATLTIDDENFFKDFRKTFLDV